MNELTLMTLSFFMASIIVSLMHPVLVKVARLKNIVDNPDPRKLQREPVPVLGGVGVITALLITCGLFSSFHDSYNLNTVFAIIFMMLFIGVADDILDVRADLKLVWQFVGIALLMACEGFIFTDMQGLFGIHLMPDAVAIGLTMLGCTGMITAVNFIDGVDGLVSGYGILVSVVCGVAFYLLNDLTFALFSIGTAGALLPFFLHNVFGHRWKMFFGDGGAMALGVIFSILIIHFLKTDKVGEFVYCPLGFILALFSMVLFDGLRVIVYRFIKRKPWQSGKHHLHHFFIAFGFSHFATTCMILGMNISVVFVWYITSYLFGFSEEAVLLSVLLYGFLVTLVPAFLHSRLVRKK